jgi:hypothetical protein
MADLEIERKGGYAGFGGPHLKSRGEVSYADLSATDRASVEALFERPAKGQRRGSGAARSLGAPGGDRFVYRISRRTSKGVETVEVSEDLVPQALRERVKDYLE